MNNGRMWLVVNPTVGIPIFLGAVAVGSFAVHVAVLSNTTWVDDFLSGRPLGSSAAIESPTNLAGKASGVQTSQVQIGDLKDGATVVLPDGRRARLVIEEPALETARVDKPPTAPN